MGVSVSEYRYRACYICSPAYPTGFGFAFASYTYTCLRGDVLAGVSVLE